MFWGPQQPGDVEELWGHKFQWTTEHPTEEDLKHLIYTYDSVAEYAIDRLDVIVPPLTTDAKCPFASEGSPRDLYALLLEHGPTDESLNPLYKQITEIPEWVDWDQIERGQRLIYVYSAQFMLGLLYKSLIGGMGAWRVVETLTKTGGFSLKVTKRRLLETLQHFLEITDDLESVKPGGKGFVSSVRVRMLHAGVRRRIMKLVDKKPDYFDIETFGIPINDLHCIGTIVAYSAAAIYMSLPRQGVYLSRQEIEDYFALWRWVGYLLGTPVDWLETPEKAKAMMESLIKAEIQPSATSRIIANNIITAESNIPPFHASREFVAAQTYMMNKHELATALGVEKPRLWYRVMFWTQTASLWCFSYSYKLLPQYRRLRRDQAFKRLCSSILLDPKKGGMGQRSMFDLKYQPEIGKSTTLIPYEEETREIATEKPTVPVQMKALAPMAMGVVLVAGATFTLLHFQDVMLDVSQLAVHTAIVVPSQALGGLA